MTMPYPTAPLMHPVMDKGYGKGGFQHMMQPLPHQGPPPTAGPSSWMPNLQMMATPAPPAMPKQPTVSDADQKTAQQAQKNLNKLLNAIKKEEEDNLPPNLQAMAHDMQKKDEGDNTRGAMSAVKSLGNEEALLQAENVRAQLVSQRKTFLQQSVVKWQEFTAQLQASEVADQERIQQARLVVKRAQRRFDYASKIVKIGDGEEAQEISDEEFEELEMREDDMPVTSLKELSESADQLEQRVKRPRKTIDEETAQPFLSKACVS